MADVSKWSWTFFGKLWTFFGKLWTFLEKAPNPGRSTGKSPDLP